MTVIESFRNSSTILFFQPVFSSFTIVKPRVLEGGVGFSHHGERPAPDEPLGYPKFGLGKYGHRSTERTRLGCARKPRAAGDQPGLKALGRGLSTANRKPPAVGLLARGGDRLKLQTHTTTPKGWPALVWEWW